MARGDSGSLLLDPHSGELRCLVLISQFGRMDAVLRALDDGIREAGAVPIFLDPQRSRLSEETFAGNLPDADVVIAEVTRPSAQVYYEIGFAHAIGKIIVLLVQEGRTVPASLLGAGPSIQYTQGPDGSRELTRRLAEVLREIRQSPGRYLRVPPTALPAVDVGDLSPAELENLCLELLTQMGFEDVQWAPESSVVDLTATLVRRDPDGFRFDEHWFVFFGSRRSSDDWNSVFDADPDELLSLIPDPQELRLYDPLTETPLAPYQPTLLIVALSLRDGMTLRERANLFRQRLDIRSRLPGARARVWDPRDIGELVRQYPQLAYKYFSEERRTGSSHRKSQDEIYRENVGLYEEVRTMAQNLQRALDDLQEERNRRATAERDAAWKDIAFTAAHKIGNPVFMLETNLSAIERRVEQQSYDELPAITSAMSEAVEKAKQIIDQFKSLTHAEELHIKATDLESVIDASCHLAREQNVGVDIDISDDTPKVFADPARLAEVFDELVANALQWFDKEERSIRVQARPADDDVIIDTDLDPNQTYVEIFFEDNGQGVPENDVPQIFAPFYTTSAHGTGLGLALVDRLISAMGGEIYEIGTPGEGAVFLMYLPTAGDHV